MVLPISLFTTLTRPLRTSVAFIRIFKSTSQCKMSQNTVQPSVMPIPITHYKCRNSVYPQSDVIRQTVPDDKVSWQVAWPEYRSHFYVAPSAVGKLWADPGEILPSTGSFAWNCLDGHVDRQSHLGHYEVIDGVPRNPIGRTGLTGRGLLGRWGPNHAADPIVTRWKTDETGNIVHDDATHLPILQFVAIQRRDTKEWAIPGGMIDPGEVVTKTLQREFEEESLNSLEMSEEDRTAVQASLKEVFSNGSLVYKGYVDDPRNTDNAWMETVAMNFHGSAVMTRIRLQAGDDAAQVRWMDVHRGLDLFASHGQMIETVTGMLHAHW